MSDISTSDMLALANNIKDSDGMMGGNSSWLWWILIIFFLFSGGFGYGNNSAAQNALTRAEMQDGFNNQNIVNTLGNMSNQINSGFDGVQLGMSTGFNGVQASLAESRYAMQDCCCQIKNAIAADGEATRALLTQNTIQELRDKLNDKNLELAQSNILSINQNQTNTLQAYLRQVVNGGCCGC